VRKPEHTFTYVRISDDDTPCGAQVKLYYMHDRRIVIVLHPYPETTIYMVSIRIGIIALSQGDGFFGAYLLTAKTGDAFVGINLRDVALHGQGRYGALFDAGAAGCA
jgi:hypothetical protein